MAFDEFDYSRKWTDPEDFPTYEYDEGTVRDDMQALFDEIRDAFNDFATQAYTDITELQGAIDDIEAGQVPDGSINSNKLAPNSVESGHIVNGTIINEDIANTTIQPAKLVNANTSGTTGIPGSGISGVTSKIRRKSIGPADLVNASDTTGVPGSGISGVQSKIREKSIAGLEIADKTIGPDKLVDGGLGKGIPGSALDGVQSKIYRHSIGTLDIGELAITTELIEDNAVTADKIYAPGLTEILSTPEYRIGADQIAVGAVSRATRRNLAADNWQEETINGFTYFTQDISDSVVKITDHVFADVSLPFDDDAQETALEEWSKMRRVYTDNGKITFEANERPTETLVVNLLFIGR